LGDFFAICQEVFGLVPDPICFDVHFPPPNWQASGHFWWPTLGLICIFERNPVCTSREQSHSAPLVIFVRFADLLRLVTQTFRATTPHLCWSMTLDSAPEVAMKHKISVCEPMRKEKFVGEEFLPHVYGPGRNVWF
jgi:hypothetical protein